MESTTRLMKFHLFNCDNTYKLDSVENLLRNMESKYDFKILVEKRYFRLQQISEMCETTIPKLQMDLAIFVVHAHESRLSINEDNAGIGYARFYRALLQATGGRVLIVIGGDDQYRGDDEEERTVISRWAQRKVASQFNKECLDGRRSFIFSWNKQHREIHEEALLHYFDPSKKGQKFEHQPKPKPVPLPEPKIIRAPDVDSDEEPLDTDDREPLLLKSENGRRSQRQKDKKPYRATLTPSPAPPVVFDVDSVPADYPEGMVLLDTQMRYGEISYDDEDVQSWDQRWHPSEKTVQDLARDWRSIPVAKVLFISNGVGGVYCNVVKPREGFRSWLSPFYSLTDSCWKAVSWVRDNPIKACLFCCCALLLSFLCECFEKIKGCTIATFHCIRGALISFYEWLRKKCHKNRSDDIYLIAGT